MPSPLAPVVEHTLAATVTPHSNVVLDLNCPDIVIRDSESVTTVSFGQDDRGCVTIERLDPAPARSGGSRPTLPTTLVGLDPVHAGHYAVVRVAARDGSICWHLFVHDAGGQLLAYTLRGRIEQLIGLDSHEPVCASERRVIELDAATVSGPPVAAADGQAVALAVPVRDHEGERVAFATLPLAADGSLEFDALAPAGHRGLRFADNDSLSTPTFELAGPADLQPFGRSVALWLRAIGPCAGPIVRDGEDLFELAVGNDGHAVVRAGFGQRRELVRDPSPVPDRQWIHYAASLDFDGQRSRLCLARDAQLIGGVEIPAVGPAHLGGRVPVLDGVDDWIEVPAIPALTRLTVTLWVRSAGPSWNATGCLLAKPGGFALQPNADTTTMVLLLASAGWVGVSESVADPQRWHHYAGTFDGERLSLYVDGRLLVSTLFDGSFASEAGPLILGRHPSKPGRHFAGSVADLCVFSRALSEAEIRATMHAPGGQDALVARHALTEGEDGGDALDPVFHGDIVFAAPTPHVPAARPGASAAFAGLRFGEGWSGEIEQLRVWDRGLEPAALVGLAGESAALTGPDASGWWPMAVLHRTPGGPAWTPDRGPGHHRAEAHGSFVLHHDPSVHADPGRAREVERAEAVLREAELAHGRGRWASALVDHEALHRAELALLRARDGDTDTDTDVDPSMLDELGEGSLVRLDSAYVDAELDAGRGPALCVDPSGQIRGLPSYAASVATGASSWSLTPIDGGWAILHEASGSWLELEPGATLDDSRLRLSPRPRAWQLAPEPDGSCSLSTQVEAQAQFVGLRPEDVSAPAVLGPPTGLAEQRWRLVRAPGRSRSWISTSTCSCDDLRMRAIEAALAELELPADEGPSGPDSAALSERLATLGTTLDDSLDLDAGAGGLTLASLPGRASSLRASAEGWELQLRDHAGHLRRCTRVAGQRWRLDGPGWAAVAAGADAHRLARPLLLEPNRWTFATWVFVADADPHAPPRVFASADGRADAPLAIRGDRLGCLVDGMFFDSGLCLTSELAAGWHHLAAVARDGSTEFWVDGRRVPERPTTRRVIELDGSHDRVLVALDDHPDDAIAVSAWVRLRGRVDDPTTLARFVTQAIGWELRVAPTLELAVGDETLTCERRIDDARWHQIGLRWDAATGVAALSVDGSPVASARLGQGQALATTGTLILGAAAETIGDEARALAGRLGPVSVDRRPPCSGEGSPEDPAPLVRLDMSTQIDPAEGTSTLSDRAGGHPVELRGRPRPASVVPQVRSHIAVLGNLGDGRAAAGRFAEPTLWAEALDGAALDDHRSGAGPGELDGPGLAGRWTARPTAAIGPGVGARLELPSTPAKLPFGHPGARVLAREGGPGIGLPLSAMPASFTIELWLRRARLGGRQGLLRCGELDLSLDEDMLTIVLGPESLTAEFPLADRVWHHLALSLSNDADSDVRTLVAWLDTAPLATLELAVDTELAGLAETASLGHGFHGLLAELRVWDHVRSPEQLATEHARRINPNNPSNPGLVARWALDGAALPSPVADAAPEPVEVVHFTGGGHVANHRPIEGLVDEVTVEVWLRGGPGLPTSGTLFSATRGGERVLNIHVPWGDGVVYWDAGNAGVSYDRIQKQASPEEFRGAWTHWAFTKDPASGEMAIYRDGELWHREGGKHRTMGPVASITIGAYLGYACPWDGHMSELRVWGRARSQAQIRAWMHRRAAADEPGLLACWPLDEIIHDGGLFVPDIVADVRDAIYRVTETETAEGLTLGDPPNASGPTWTPYATDLPLAE